MVQQETDTQDNRPVDAVEAADPRDERPAGDAPSEDSDRASTLTPSSNLSDVDINATFGSTSASNDLRIGCFGSITTIEIPIGIGQISGG